MGNRIDILKIILFLNGILFYKHVFILLNLVVISINPKVSLLSIYIKFLYTNNYF